MLTWEPLSQVLSLQLRDGSFPYSQKTPTAQPTFLALRLLERCGMTVEDEPVSRALAYLTGSHLRKGALSFTYGASAILPCYLGVVAALQALAAIPAPARTQEVNDAITQALEYLRIHRVHRSSLTGRPCFAT